jgi:hypothetical protein
MLSLSQRIPHSLFWPSIADVSRFCAAHDNLTRVGLLSPLTLPSRKAESLSRPPAGNPTQANLTPISEGFPFMWNADSDGCGALPQCCPSRSSEQLPRRCVERCGIRSVRHNSKQTNHFAIPSMCERHRTHPTEQTSVTAASHSFQSSRESRCTTICL